MTDRQPAATPTFLPPGEPAPGQALPWCRRDAYALLALLLPAVWLFAPAFTGLVLDGNTDRFEMFTPLHIFAARTLQQGEWPHWNPDSFCGTSFWGTSANYTGYPPYLALYLLPPATLPRLLTWLVFGHLLIGLFASYLFFRQFLHDRFWGGLSALVYLASIPAMQALTSEDCFVPVAWLPAWGYLILTDSRRTGRANLLRQTAVATVCLLSGELQGCAHLAGIAIVFACFRSGRFGGGPRDRGAFRAAATTVAAFVLALLLCSFRLLPFVQWCRANTSLVTIPYLQHLEHTPGQPLDLLRFFLPDVLGREQDGQFLGSCNRFESFACSSGIAAGSLALFSCFFLWPSRSLVWKALLLFMLGVYLKTPLALVYHWLAAGTSLASNRIVWTAALPMAVLFGMAGQRCERSVRTARAALLWSLFLLAAVAATIGHLYPALIAEARPETMVGIDAALRQGAAAAAAFIAILFLWSGSGTARHPLLIRLLFVAVLVLDLFPLAWHQANVGRPWLVPEPYYPADRRWEAAAAVLGGDQAHYRVGYAQRSSRPADDLHLVAGLRSSGGYDVVPPEAVVALLNHGGDQTRFTARWGSANALAAPLTSTRCTITDTGLVIVPEVLPRAALFSDYVVSDDALAVLGQSGFPWRTRLVLDRQPAVVPPPGGVDGSATIVRESNCRVVLAVVVRAAALLLLTDSYADGWSALLDGVPTPLLRANHAFRAIAVPAGRHRVEFAYDPPGVAVGSAVTLLTAAFLLGLAVCRRGQ